MTKAVCVLLALAMSLPPALVQAQPAAVAVKDMEVARGIKAVEDGDYDAAIFVLDAATRRLAADPKNPDLPQAYLHLGIAYVGKGAEAAAKAKFREALKQVRDLALSADKYPPKVINVFEAARDEVRRDAALAGSAAPGHPAAGPRTPAQPKKGGGGGKTLLIVGGLGAAGAGVALAAGGGGGGSDGTSSGDGGGLQTRTFANEVVVFGGGRDFVVDARGSGTLTARCTWVQDGVLLGMYIVALANPGVVLKDAGQTASKELTLTQAVTPGSYRISVTNSSGAGPVVDTTFTLTVTLP
jgi:hypothetical protein